MKRITRSAIVECSAEEFYALVEDIEAYPGFLPWCAAAEVRERSPGRTVATLTLVIKGIRQSFTTENEWISQSDSSFFPVTSWWMFPARQRWVSEKRFLQGKKIWRLRRSLIFHA